MAVSGYEALILAAFNVSAKRGGRTFGSCRELSPRQVQVVLERGLINWVKQRLPFELL